MGSMVSFVKKSHSSKRMNWILFIIFVLTSVILIIFNVELVLVNSSSTVKRDHDINNRVCGDDNSVSVYLLKTKLGVSYQGSHWFHVAENFMAYHSALRAQNRQTCSPRVLYLFDKDKFTEELNGMTKMMIALGSLADLTSPPCLQQQRSAQVTSQSIYFGRLHSDWTTMGLKPGRTVSIPQSIFSELTVEQLSTGVATDSRFISKQVIDLSSKSTSHASLRSVDSVGGNGSSVTIHGDSLWSVDAQPSICARVDGEVGGVWPTPQRGHWFPSASDVTSFRRKITSLCPKDASLLQKYSKSRTYKMIIYQRDISRKLDGLEESLVRLRNHLSDTEWEIQVLMHKKDRSPCELTHIFNGVDVLLTPHGFQSMLLLFLPKPAVLFEVFPYRYFKRGYGPLSLEYGIIHSGVMSPALTLVAKYFLSFVRTDYCMASKLCRGYARDTDVKLTEHGIEQLMKTIALYKTIKSSMMAYDSFYS